MFAVPVSRARGAMSPSDLGNSRSAATGAAAARILRGHGSADPPPSRTSGLAWAVLAAACVTTLAGDWLAWLDRDAGLQQRYATSAADVVIGLGFLVVPAMGALIASRHPRNPVGWVLCAAGLAYAAARADKGLRGPCAARGPGALPGGRYVAWLEESTRLFAIPLVGTFGVLLFPTGRLPSPRWRPAAWLAIADVRRAVRAVCVRHAGRLPVPREPVRAAGQHSAAGRQRVRGRVPPAAALAHRPRRRR